VVSRRVGTHAASSATAVQMARRVSDVITIEARPLFLENEECPHYLTRSASKPANAKLTPPTTST
jgi:hypothetical protein